MAALAGLPVAAARGVSSTAAGRTKGFFSGFFPEDIE